jgi:hypothetical protein
LLIASFLNTCGGSSSSSAIEDTDIETQSSEPTMGFKADIEPIMQAKCIGCHNSGDNPLAPFSLEGIELVNSFKSAIHFVLESSTMPPADAQQLTSSERAKLLVWLNGEPYDHIIETLRISLVEAEAWDRQPKNRDVFTSHRPDEVHCEQETGWVVEEEELEVRTEFCNYLSLSLSLSQNSLLDLATGTELEFVLSHSELNFNAPATAHFAISIAGTPIWETTVEIPSGNDIIKPKRVRPGINECQRVGQSGRRCCRRLFSKIGQSAQACNKLPVPQTFCENVSW